MTEDTKHLTDDTKLAKRLDIHFALKAARLGLWELDPVTNLINWDDRCRELFGLAKENRLPYEQAIRHIHPEDVDRVDQAVRRAMNPKSGGDYDVTYRTIGADDGRLRCVRFTGQGYFTETGEVCRFVGIAQDVTKDVRLEESEARFRSLIDESPVATCLFVGREMRIELANDLALAIWGKGKAVLGELYKNAVPELAGQPVFDLLDDVFTSGRVYEAKAAPVELVREGERSTFYFDYTNKPLRNADGEVYAILCMAVDVTRQVMAQEKLQKSETYFRQLTDTIPAILWITEPDGYCTYLNQQWYDSTGQTSEEAEGYGWLDATHPDDKEEAGKLFVEANEQQKSFNAVYQLRQKDGSYRWVIDKGSPRFGPNGAYEGMIGTVVDIHDQKLAEEKTAQFKYMADNASDPFLLIREDGTFAYLNTLALDRWGYTAEEAAPIRVPDVDVNHNDAVFKASFARAQAGELLSFETRHRKKDGTFHPVEVNMGGLMLGQQPHLFAVARDLTERRRVEQDFRESEALFRNVANSSPTGLWLSDEAGGLVYLNNTLVDWTGLPYEALLGTGWASAIIEEDRQRSAHVFMTAVAARAHYDVVFRLEKGDGTLMWCRAAGDPYYRADGSFAGYAGFCMDIDELLKQRQVSEASEARLRSVFANAPAGMGLFVGRDLIIELPNQTFIDIVGKGPDIVGKPLYEVMPELITENQPFLQILDDVYTSGKMFQSFGSQVDIVRQGVMMHNFYNITYTPLLDAEGRIYAILNVAVDVTEQVLARKRTEEAEAALRGVVELAQLATWSLDIEQGTFAYSKRFMDWLGFSEETKSVDEAYNPLPDEYRQSVADALNAVIQPGASGFYENEHPIINRLTGQVRVIHAQAQVLYDASGKPILLRGSAQDVTEQRRVQQELERQVQQRTQQLQASVQDLQRSNENLKEFAYIASHDLQEPLRKIQSFGDMLKDQYANQLGDGVNHLVRIQSAASRMSTLIKDLLTYSRISTQQEATNSVSLNDVVQTVLTDLDLVTDETGATISVEPLPTVQGDESQLTQLFQNLLSNALKFRRAGSSPVIQISTQRVAATQLPPSVQPTRAAAYYHLVMVTDNGIGFEEKYVQRIFQVFQRLHGKNEFAGTGIGLAICEKVTANHGGAITATSKPGQGTTFSVYLPVQD